MLHARRLFLGGHAWRRARQLFAIFSAQLLERPAAIDLDAAVLQHADRAATVDDVQVSLHAHAAFDAPTHHELGRRQLSDDAARRTDRHVTFREYLTLDFAVDLNAPLHA